MSCGTGRRCSLDPVLLWLWCRLAASAPIPPLACEFPYATSWALKSKKRKKKGEQTLLPFSPRLHKYPSATLAQFYSIYTTGCTVRKGRELSGQNHLFKIWIHVDMLPPKSYVASNSQYQGMGAPRSTKFSK